MSHITKIHARQIFDSRGNPTIEVEVTTAKGVFRAAVPSGASTGAHEAVELRDNIKNEYGGKGVLQVVENINHFIGPKLIASKISVTEQKMIDKFLINLDGTESKSKLGANAILGISLAVVKAGATAKEKPLYAYFAELMNSKLPYIMPVPCFNVINGGKHAGNELAMQEFMLMPVGASSFREAMKMGTETYHILKDIIKSKYGLDATNVGDEGGFAPSIKTAEEALDLLISAIEKAGYTNRIKIGLDAAASELYRDGKYDMSFKSSQSTFLTGQEMVDFYKELFKKYPLILLEDPFDENDWENFAKLNEHAENFELVGDDLLVTNPKKIKYGIEKKACNALLLKVNQIGTITETLEAANLAFGANWGVFVSHRSGETEDTSIADLVVGLRTGHIKTGAPCRSERLAKYNQLLRIEEELGSNCVYAGENFHYANKM
ncbi:hypothetical protein NQZ79_g8345 [Umbelopsis isabellina]|nr:hypothetical protein NQZ79_g8345 [Umbelopsis isabellina]